MSFVRISAFQMENNILNFKFYIVVTQLEVKFVGFNEVSNLFGCILVFGLICKDEFSVGGKKLVNNYFFFIGK